jgi:xanthine dehydrogenase small subunit
MAPERDQNFEADISALAMGLALKLSADGQTIEAIRIGVGGMAAIPVRARLTEAALQDSSWNIQGLAEAARVLENEFKPLSDMRASDAYRRQALGAALLREWSRINQAMLGASA